MKVEFISGETFEQVLIKPDNPVQTTFQRQMQEISNP